MADTLREYLIELGFKVDENGWKGFNEKLARSAENTAKLGATVVGVAATIQVAVEKVARSYEELYYVSQRTGGGVNALRASEFGFRQIGSSAEAARGSIEGFAAAVRTNPGLKAMFQGMGIDTGNSQKAIGQMVDKLKSQYGEGGYFIAQQFAQMGGMDEQTFRQVWMNREKLRAQEEASARRQKEAGIDGEKYAQDSVKFQDTLRETQEKWSLLIDRVSMGWLPTAQKTVEVAGNIADAFTAADKATNGWAGKVATLAVSLGTVKASLTVVMGILRALGIAAPAGAASLGVRAAVGRAALLRFGPAGAFVAGMGLGPANGKESPLKGGGPSPEDTSPEAQAWRSKNGGGNASLADSIKRTAANLGVDPMDVATAISYETGGTFDKWKKGPTTQWGEHRGLIQWGEPQRKKYGVSQNSTEDEQMQAVEKYLKDAGVKPGMKLLDIYSAINAGRVGLYNRSDANNGGAPGTVADKVNNQMGGHRNNARALLGDNTLTSGGGGANVTISHKTENNITGVSDPKKAASMIDEAQSRTNGNIVRNTKSVFN